MQIKGKKQDGKDKTTQIHDSQTDGKRAIDRTHIDDKQANYRRSYEAIEAHRQARRSKIILIGVNNYMKQIKGKLNEHDSYTHLMHNRI